MVHLAPRHKYPGDGRYEEARPYGAGIRGIPDAEITGEPRVESRRCIPPQSIHVVPNRMHAIFTGNSLDRAADYSMCRGNSFVLIHSQVRLSSSSVHFSPAELPLGVAFRVITSSANSS